MTFEWEVWKQINSGAVFELWAAWGLLRHKVWLLPPRCFCITMEVAGTVSTAFSLLSVFFFFFFDMRTLSVLSEHLHGSCLLLLVYLLFSSRDFGKKTKGKRVVCTLNPPYFSLYIEVPRSIKKNNTIFMRFIFCPKMKSIGVGDICKSLCCDLLCLTEKNKSLLILCLGTQ